MTGAIAFVEKFFWTMVWIILVLIIAYALLGWAENAGGNNIFGRFAQWINDHARPQAS